jgi:spore coat polysaccharide biosynthesis protein SpsF
MTKRRAGIVLLARMGSSRLPGKSLLEVCGRPVIAHQFDRLRQSRKTETLVLATSTLAQDDPLEAAAQAAGVACFRGSPADVVLRLADAATKHRLDFLAVVGGDDVFCEGEFIDRVIDFDQRSPIDFISIDGLPFGTAPFGVDAKALRKVLEIKPGEYTDGWERYLTDTGLFRTTMLQNEDPSLAHPEIRLDLDYDEDFALVKAIYERLYKPGTVPDLRRIVRLLVDEEPALAQINRAAHEKWLQNRKAMPLPMVAPRSAS